MSVIKSFSVGNGDMFYINHNSRNFTIIDSCNYGSDWKDVKQEIRYLVGQNEISRFISTHPDADHIGGLSELDNEIGIINFYCVQNESKKDNTPDFIKYSELHDSSKAFYISKGVTRKWMNIGDEERGQSGIEVLWPDRSHQAFIDALSAAKQGESPNNLSPILQYSVTDGVTALWMGDLETDFMESIADSVTLPKADILFAPHHGRESGKVPSSWLSVINPQVIIVGEAKSEHLHYYPDHNTITQNSAGHISIVCEAGYSHFYVQSGTYSVNFLLNLNLRNNEFGRYIGSIQCR